MTNHSDIPTPMAGKAQPERATVAGEARLTIVDNALATALMSGVRDARTGTAEFGRLSTELAKLAIWEACRSMPLTSVSVPGFAGNEIKAQTRAEQIAGVFILRAGMLFAAPYRDLFGDAPLYQVGVRREESTLEAQVYANNVPTRVGWADRVLVFDPMLATGGSASRAIGLVRERHGGPIDVVVLIAAPVGVRAVLAADETCRVFAVALDDRLDERGFIVPGLGDAGDRLFGTS